MRRVILVNNDGFATNEAVAPFARCFPSHSNVEYARSALFLVVGTSVCMPYFCMQRLYYTALPLRCPLFLYAVPSFYTLSPLSIRCPLFLYAVPLFYTLPPFSIRCPPFLYAVPLPCPHKSNPVARSRNTILKKRIIRGPPRII